MQKLGINIAAPNLTCICIDGEIGHEGWGKIYHCYSKDGQSFSNIHQLIKLMDDLMDHLKYPQSSMKLRTFKDNNVKYEGELIGEQVMDKNDVLKNRGEKGTFVVHVMYRQNATWQGEVVWTEKGEVRKFRSALELMKLIDSALETQETNEAEDKETEEKW